MLIDHIVKTKNNLIPEVPEAEVDKRHSQTIVLNEDISLMELSHVDYTRPDYEEEHEDTSSNNSVVVVDDPPATLLTKCDKCNQSFVNKGDFHLHLLFDHDTNPVSVNISKTNAKITANLYGTNTNDKRKPTKVSRH